MHRDGKYIFLTGQEFRDGRLSETGLFSSVGDDQIVPVGIPATYEGIQVPLERIGKAASAHMAHAEELKRDFAANVPELEALDQKIKSLFDMMVQMNELVQGPVVAADTLADEAQRFLRTGVL